MSTAAGPAARPPWRHVVTLVAAVEAVAIAAWLIPASVHIVSWSESGPERVALFAPLTRLRWFVAIGLMVALALAALSRKAGLPAKLAAMAAPICLLWLWVVPYLPWLPDRVPLLLVLAGPIRWVIAGVALAGALPIGSRVSALIPAERQMPARKSVFVASLALYLFFGMNSSRVIGPGGDEPHYLIISQSLLADGDLQIENNHRRGEYRQFFGGNLRPDFLRRGQNGQIYSVHAPGLPVMVLPAYAAAGYRGVVVFMCLIAALAALAIFDLAEAVAGRRAALFAWGAVCLTVPFVPHGWLVFPETPGALVVAWAALWVWQPVEQRVSTWMWRGLALGLLVWLHTKFAIFLALFAAALLVRLWRRPKAIAALGAPIVLCVAAWLYFFYAIYGVIDPEAPYGDYTRTFVLLRNIPRGLLGLLFDQKFGLLSYSPIYLLALPGVWFMMRRADSRYLAAVLALVAAAYVGSSARLYMWWGGSSAPARFLVPVLPCLAPMVAMAALEARSRAARALMGVWLTVSVAVAIVGVWWPERFFLFSDPHGRARLIETIQAGSPLAWSLPTFTEEDWRSSIGQLGPWLVAGAAGLAVMTWVARSRAATALWLGTVASLTFLFTAGVAARRIAPEAREELARRGALELIWRVDGDRLSAFNYGDLHRVDAEGLKRLSTVVFRRLPEAVAGPGYATEQFALPAGTYEARVWSAASHGQGEVVVSAYDRLVFGRVAGALANPSVVQFELPVDTGRLTVRVPDTTALAVAKVEVAPVAVVPLSARDDRLRIRTIEAIPDRPGGYVVHVDPFTYPEGSVFWTRDTERATVLVAPAGASRMIVTLHLGPMSGNVLVSVAGKETAVHVNANDTTVVDVEVPPDLRLVPVTIQSPGRFRPSEVDPSATDTRRLGCQVRIGLK
jgi:hypothetical protein